MKYWQCSVCKYIHQGDEPPEKCPVCGVDSSKFVEIDEADVPEKTPKRQKMPANSVAASDKSSAVEQPSEQADTPLPKNEAGYEHLRSLLIKHHAHPVSVHTPNGLLPVVVVLFLLAWMFDSQLLAKAAMINLIFVLLALPFVIFTGIIEWKQKYNGALTTVFKIKIFAATMTSITSLISLIWYLFDPQILDSTMAWTFLTLNLLMLAAAGIAGHIGGKLVFKD